MKLLPLFALSLMIHATLPAHAKITRLSASDITGVQEKVVGKCQAGWGSRMNVVISTRSEKFVYIYCSEQPLSHPMGEVYGTLRDFVAGPDLGACEIKTYCDQWNRCSYAQGQKQTTVHQLVLITDEKNQIVEDYNDIRVISDTACRPITCR
jgi:hypothetical protein